MTEMEWLACEDPSIMIQNVESTASTDNYACSRAPACAGFGRCCLTSGAGEPSS